MGGGGPFVGAGSEGSLLRSLIENSGRLPGGFGLSSLRPPWDPQSSIGTILTGLKLPKKRSLFVSYHHAGDQAYYDALAGLCDDCDFLEDHSVDRRIQSDDVEYQERRIREQYITGTTATVVLCGATTPERKFVDWEIYATLYKEKGLIGIRLPSARLSFDYKVIVPHRLHDNIESGYAVWHSWNEVTATNLRSWIEIAVNADKSRIRNWRDKKVQNG